MLATSTRLPTVEELRSLSMADIAIAAGLADSMRDIFREYVQVDPFCVADPFADKDEFNYSVVLDSENPNRVVAILASNMDSLPQLPWSSILGRRLVKLSMTKIEAAAIKHELLPKMTNNFYPYRRNGRIAGYVTFAFQICGLR
ncbi:MAG: hypothetical protein ACREA4_09325 [Nitrososphaera sp.]